MQAKDGVQQKLREKVKCVNITSIRIYNFFCRKNILNVLKH